MTLDHDQVQERFDRLRDDDLPAEERAAVESHLAGCAPCRAAHDRYERTMTLLGAMKPQQAPENFVDKVTGQIRTRSRGKFFSRPVDWSSRLPYEVLSVVMLIAIIAIFLFIFLGRGGGAISH